MRMSGLLPTDYAELDRTLCELEDLRSKPVITAVAWGERFSFLSRSSVELRWGNTPLKLLTPGRNVSSAACPTPTSLASGPVLFQSPGDSSSREGSCPAVPIIPAGAVDTLQPPFLRPQPGRLRHP